MPSPSKEDLGDINITVILIIINIITNPVAKLDFFFRANIYFFSKKNHYPKKNKQFHLDGSFIVDIVFSGGSIPSQVQETES